MNDQPSWFDPSPVAAAALLAVVLSTAAAAARVPLLIDATPWTFHFEPEYARGLSEDGPVAERGNLSLHLVRGLYGGEAERPATAAVYDALPDRSRVFFASGFRFEAQRCGDRFLLLNWTGTMGSHELTLIELDLERDRDRWVIGRILLTRYSTNSHSNLEDVAPCAAAGQDSGIQHPEQTP